MSDEWFYVLAGAVGTAILWYPVTWFLSKIGINVYPFL
jgi:hypothetical protein